MKKHKVEHARRLAREFNALALDVVQESNDNWLWGSKKTGALRRKSMDLTRALAEMRKP
jgi:hypothetical protein